MCPGEGGSDWDCWSCAAASRMGCPHGLAVARTDKNGTRRRHKADTKQKREIMGGISAQRILGRVVHKEKKKISTEEGVGEWRCGPRKWRKMMTERKNKKERKKTVSEALETLTACS